MAPKPNMLNVRKHLEHIQLTLELIQKYGMCPLVEDSLREISLSSTEQSCASMMKPALRATAKTSE
jgi:hypothetical protein